MICDGCTHAENCPAKAEHGGAKRCSAFKPMTEQEYLQTCNTEQLAEWLSNHVKFVYDCGLREVLPKTMYEEDWEWWLKQPHQMTTK